MFSLKRKKVRIKTCQNKGDPIESVNFKGMRSQKNRVTGNELRERSTVNNQTFEQTDWSSEPEMFTWGPGPPEF